MYSSFLGISSFIYHFTFSLTFSFFFFFWEIALQLEYSVAFLSKSMKFSSFWAQACNKEAQDQGISFRLCRILDAMSIAYLLPQAQSPLFSKGLFPLRPIIAIRLWSYKPLKLGYTLGFRDKPPICENSFSFIPQYLKVYHNFKAIPSIFSSFICPLELGEHMIYGSINKRYERYPW